MTERKKQKVQTDDTIVRAAFEIPKPLHKKVKGIANELDVTMRVIVIQALELWVGQNEQLSKDSFAVATGRIEADLFRRLTDLGEARRESTEQLVRRALEKYLEDYSTKTTSSGHGTDTKSSTEDTTLADRYKEVYANLTLALQSADPAIREVAIESLNVWAKWAKLVREHGTDPGGLESDPASAEKADPESSGGRAATNGNGGAAG